MFLPGSRVSGNDAEGVARRWKGSASVFDESEVEKVLAVPDEQKHRIELALGARGGLRSHEIVQVVPEQVIDTDAGTMLTSPEGKGDKHRETPSRIRSPPRFVRSGSTATSHRPCRS
jgi:integrase